MARTARDWAWGQELQAHRKLVLLDLADRTPEGHVGCWRRVREVAARTGMSERQVRRSLQELEGAGLIWRVQVDGDAGWQISSGYVLRVQSMSDELWSTWRVRAAGALSRGGVMHRRSQHGSARQGVMPLLADVSAPERLGGGLWARPWLEVGWRNKPAWWDDDTVVAAASRAAAARVISGLTGKGALPEGQGGRPVGQGPLAPQATPGTGTGTGQGTG